MPRPAHQSFVTEARQPFGETVHGHDAAIHAIAIGFILSMVFAHAPIILPAISGAPVRYVPILYLPAALLQLSIGLRIVFDAVDATDLLYIPAWLTIVAIKDEGGAVARYVALFSDITEHKASEARIRFLSEHDFLTGLPNRALFADRLMSRPPRRV